MPDWLSRSEFKRQLYGIDTYAIEGLEVLYSVAGDAARLFSHQYSLLVVKPEAVVTRQLERIFTWLEQTGFAIAEAVPFRFTPGITRGIWAYHWNAATGAHREIVDLLVESGPSVAVLVRTDKPNGLPATLRLAALKGHADPARRQPGQLRYELGNYNALLNHVHSPDEPIDLLRELAVIFARPDLERVLCSAQREQTLGALHLGQTLTPPLYQDAGAPCSLDVSDVLAEVEGCLGSSVDGDDLGLVVSRCEEEGVALSRWQRIVLRTSCTESMRKDVRRLVPSVSAADWMAAGIDQQLVVR